jgi:hypothetical protein
MNTYASLKTAISDTLDRDDLASNIEDFILLAEARHKRTSEVGGIRIKEMIQRDPITVNARQISLPAGYLEPLTFRLLTSPVTPLNYVNQMDLIREEANGKPKNYTIGNEIEFDKAPDSSYSGEIVFYKSVDPLSASNESNAILAADPATYLYGALIASAPFLMDDPRIVIWKALYDESAMGLNAITKKARRGRNLVARTVGAIV